MPIIVIVPPTFAAMASAMSWGAAGSRAAAQICMTTGIRQATVAVLEETEDKMIVMTIKAIISRFSSVPDFFTTSTPIF